MAVYTLNEDGVATLARSALTQAELEVLVQARQITEGSPVSSCVKETLAVVTGKNKIKSNGEV